MKIESYEIRNSLGLINTLERTVSGWFDNVAHKLLNQAEMDALLKMYRSFNCQIKAIYSDPETLKISSECISIEFVAKEHYTGKEIIMYTGVRIEDYWLVGIEVPSARCEEKFIQQMISMHAKRGIEVRCYDNQSKRI